jgi:uncharacterized protein
MTRDLSPRHLDVRALAAAGASLEGSGALREYARVAAEAQGAGSERLLAWRVQGKLLKPEGRSEQVWLHLRADCLLPLTCQRCLGPVDVPVSFDRDFRFVADEATAAAEDEAAEEDVLVLSRDFDLLALVEDELLMALPVVPCHGLCPVQPVLAVADAGFEDALADQAHPFDGLRALRRDKSG